MINDFIITFKQQLNKGLPGKIAHQEAAPYRKIEFNSSDMETAKESAVLILFYPKNNQIHTVLIQRSVYDGKHSGQMAFPGGKVEKNDLTIFDTALREANEEIGIKKDTVTIIGQLSDVFIPVSNFHVIPVLGFCAYAPSFVLDKREVETIIELELQQLQSTALILNKIKLSSESTVKLPAFNFNGNTVWGATALMLNELKHLLNT